MKTVIQDKGEKNQITYGCDIDGFVDSVKNSVTYKFTGANMVIAGLMSDAQEELFFGKNENATKTINRAKHLLFMVMDGELIGTVERK